MTIALVALAAALTAYGLLLLLCLRMESRFIFFPQPLPAQARARLEAAGGLAVEDVALTAADGVSLHGWYCSPATAKRGVDRPVVLLLHGNGGNIANRSDLISALVTMGADVLALDYRGYGRSGGTPSGEGVLLDSRAAWRFLTESRRVPPERIVLFGESLGGAVAIHLAADVDCGGLIVESSFTSLREMAALRLPFIPSAIVRTRLESLETIERVRCPKLFFHGTDDRLIPISMGRRLHARAVGEKRFVAIDGAGHNDVQAVGGETYRRALETFLRGIAPATRAATRR